MLVFGMTSTTVCCLNSAWNHVSPRLMGTHPVDAVMLGALGTTRLDAPTVRTERLRICQSYAAASSVVECWDFFVVDLMDECFLKRTASLPLKIGRGPKRKFIFQLFIFRGYVGFRECNIGCFVCFNSCYGFYVSCQMQFRDRELVFL